MCESERVYECAHERSLINRQKTVKVLSSNPFGTSYTFEDFRSFGKLAAGGHVYACMCVRTFAFQMFSDSSRDERVRIDC